jgi:deltex-like protein
MVGDQPPGKMDVKVDNNSHCAGYEGVGTIIIDYSFGNGNGYTGTRRRAYLPNNDEGKEVLRLLRIAFDRRLIFTVGTSVTTG